MFDHSLIQALQAFRSPGLDALAQGISLLGDEPAYLLVLPLLYWTADRSVALRAILFLLAATWMNEVAKALLDLPRPDPGEVAVLDPRASGGLPSGHAVTGTVVWGYLALRWRDMGGSGPGGVVLGAAMLLVLAIGVTRVYLGAHFPADVLAGWGLGVTLLLGAVYLSGPGTTALSRLPLTGRFAVSVVVPAVFLALHREHEALPAAATLLGAAMGSVGEREWIRFETAAGWSRLLLRGGIGLAGALVLWAGLRGILLPGSEAGRIARYLLLGLWVTAGAPAVFRWLEGRGRGEPAPPM